LQSENNTLVYVAAADSPASVLLLTALSAALQRLSVLFPRLHFLVPAFVDPAARTALRAHLPSLPATVRVLDPLPFSSRAHVLAGCAAVLTDGSLALHEGVALGKRVFLASPLEPQASVEALGSPSVTWTAPNEAALSAQFGTWYVSAQAAGAGTVGWPPFDIAAIELQAAQQAETGLRAADLAVAASSATAATSRAARAAHRFIFGDGHAAPRIAAVLAKFASALAPMSAAERVIAVRNLRACSEFAAAALPASRPDASHLMHDSTWHAQAPLAVESAMSQRQRFQHRVECSTQPPTHRVLQRTYEEVMALPSSFSSSKHSASDAFAVTAIVSVFRRPQFFLRFLWAMGNQTHPPREVWVTTFASKHEDEFRAMVREHDRTGAVYKFIAGDANFKYFGRFALASMAKTPYVVLFDDDCIPGRKVVANLLHTINLRSGDYNGLLGMKGHGQILDDVNSDQHVLYPYWSHWQYRPESAVQVDLTGGVWFLRTEWLGQMWREQPIPVVAGSQDITSRWETGEDFHLTCSLRKFLNIETILFPVAEKDEDTWGHSHDYFDISGSGDSTAGNTLTLRSNILYGNLLRGYTPARSDTLWGEAWQRTNVAVLLPSVEAARAVAPVVQFLRTYFHQSIRVFPVVALDPTVLPTSAASDDGTAPVVPTREAVLAAVGMQFNLPDLKVGVFDLDLRKLSSRMRWRPTDLQVETEVALGGVFETVRPAAFILPYDEASPIVTAAAMTASVLRIPAIGYTAPSPTNSAVAAAAVGAGDSLAAAIRAASAVGSDDPDCIPVPPPQSLIDASKPHPAPVFGPLPDAPVALCAARQSVSYSRGLVNFITNSQVLAVRQLFDTLCSCERGSSAGEGSFAKCPTGTEHVLSMEWAATAAR
jgi:hypothetical protein